jgi:heat shock protein HslJ
MKQIFSILIILLFCGPSCRKTESVSPELVGTKWILATIKDTKTNTVLTFPNDASRKISINFTDSLNTLAFSGICNAGTGTYSVSTEQGTLSVQDLGTTKIYCKYAEWESYTVQNLNSAFGYKINGTTLTVYSGGDYNLNFISE